MDKIEPIVNNNSNSIIKLLLEVKIKSYLYLKVEDINYLESFIDGFTYAQIINKFDICESEIYKGFFEWIKEKYNYKGELGFFSLFYELTRDQTSEKKYKTFYHLLDQYLAKIKYVSRP